MRVRVFDEMHEQDLENSVNSFLSEIGDNVIDIKYQVSISMFAEEQIYCFSAMILYKVKEED
ncbi:MAG: sporulation protein Cse60 [Bacilli bacterium]|nr:sporulation protein Cse60 [Bacilli bacterium]